MISFRRTVSQAGRRRAGQSGLSLVELMIAMTLGLILTAGVLRVFIGQRHTYAFNEGLAWIQENARFGVAQLEAHARMAGYTGCLSGIALFNNLDGPANAFRDDLTNGVEGFEFTGTGAGATYQATASDPAPVANAAAWSPALPFALAEPALVIPGSDVLVVRYISPDSNPLVAPFSDSAQLFVAPPHQFDEGQILVATDCRKASLFQLTNVQTTGFGINLVHSGNGTFDPGNSTPTWGPDQSYGLGSEVAVLQSIAFFVGQGESGSPSLYQLRLARTDSTTSEFVPEPLIDGVDTMQVRYGLDNDNDRQVDLWQSADAVDAADDWLEVISVEVSLVLRSGEEFGSKADAGVYRVAGTTFDPVDDRRLRQVFTTTIAIRNRLP
jgi:type IV pilus assembly protein PilW